MKSKVESKRRLNLMGEMFREFKANTIVDKKRRVTLSRWRNMFPFAAFCAWRDIVRDRLELSRARETVLMTKSIFDCNREIHGEKCMNDNFEFYCSDWTSQSRVSQPSS